MTGSVLQTTPRPDAELVEDRALMELADERLPGYFQDHHLENLEEWLDTKFTVPGLGFRFGLDGVIGLVPVVGDIATTGISAAFVADAVKAGARKRVVGKMLGNLVLDFAVGSVPIVGDLFDFAFKSNLKNLRILREEKKRLLAGDGPDITHIRQA